MKLGFQIPIASGLRDSLSWITDLKFQDFWFQKQEFPGFRSRITLYGDMGQLKPFTGSFTRSHRKQNLSRIPQVSITLIPVMAFVQFAIDNVVIIPLILTRDLGRSDIVLTQSSFKDNNKLHGGAIKLQWIGHSVRFILQCLIFQLISTATQSTKVVPGSFFCSECNLLHNL